MSRMGLKPKSWVSKYRQLWIAQQTWSTDRQEESACTTGPPFPRLQGMPVQTVHRLPDGQITSDFQKSCQAPKSKIFLFSPYPNQMHIHRCLVPPEGRSRVVTSAGRDAVDAAASGDVRGWQGGS